MTDLISKKIRGFRDILPEECEKFIHIENTIQKIVPSFNIQQIRIPALESISLFKRSIGEESDIVTKEMYQFEDRNNETVCMIPEGTASCMRLALENNLIYDRGVKNNRFYYIASMFRHERPQKGRYRQFTQFGVEFFGEKTLNDDIDIIMLSSTLFKILELKDVTLSINSIGSTQDRHKYSKILKQYFNKNLNYLSESQKVTLEKNPMRLLDSKDKKIKDLIQSAPCISDYINKNSRIHFEKIQNILSELGISFIKDLKLVRGLDYYNDLVFEWKTNRLGSQDAICAGGRYDNLSSIIGKHNIPAVGFAMGIDRIVNLTDFQHNKNIIGLSIVTDEFDNNYKLSKTIRDNIGAVRLIEMDYRKSLSKQIKQAVKSKCLWLIIVGNDEISNNTLTIKHLNNDNEDEVIPMVDLKKYFTRKT